MKEFQMAVILSADKISEGIYEMVLSAELKEKARPGQFLMLYPKGESTLLPRPISICEISDNKYRLVYRVSGKGTKEFSEYKEGDRVRILGPLGNGFDATKGKGKKVFVIGGGIGIPPMLELSKRLDLEECESLTAFMGYRNSDLFLKNDFEKVISLKIATEDGSKGSKGNVLDAIKESGLKADIIYACGPMPMLRALKEYAILKNIEAYISLEERMACGVGACLGCVAKTTHKDSHSQVNNKRVCTEGPVFEAREVEI